MSSAALSKLRWLERVLYASAQDRLTPSPEAEGIDDVSCDLQQPAPPLPPQQPSGLLDDPDPDERAILAARLRQKSPDLGSERHWAQVPGPLAPHPPALRAEGIGVRFSDLIPGSLMAPVDVTSMAGPTSFSDGGGV